jgi:flagellar L-ring protein precursor FlgH
MSAKVTAVVKQVLPNGTMVIEGAKSLTLNKEVQNFRITGIVRREDILPNNTVRSENIAEAIIAMNGKGMIADRQRRGILTRLLDWLF